MNKFLKYIIFFLLGVILYYFLMQTIQGQKVIEGFGTGGDISGLFSDYPLFIDSNITNVKLEVPEASEEGEVVGQFALVDSSNTSPKNIKFYTDSEDQAANEGAGTEAVLVPITKENITSNPKDIGYTYRPDYYSILSGNTVTAETFEVYLDSGRTNDTPPQFTPSENFKPIRITPPTDIESQIFYSVKNIVDGVVRTTDCYPPAPPTTPTTPGQNLTKKSWDLSGLASNLIPFNGSSFPYNSNDCIIYSSSSETVAPADRGTLFNNDFIIIKFNLNADNSKFQNIMECNVFVNINLIDGGSNDFTLTTGSTTLVGKPFTSVYSSPVSITHRDVIVSSHIDNFIQPRPDRKLPEDVNRVTDFKSNHASDLINSDANNPESNYIKRIISSFKINPTELIKIKEASENICNSDLVGKVLISGDSLLQGDIRYYTNSGDDIIVPAAVIEAFGPGGSGLLDAEGYVLARRQDASNSANRKILAISLAVDDALSISRQNIRNSVNIAADTIPAVGTPNDDSNLSPENYSDDLITTPITLTPPTSIYDGATGVQLSFLKYYLRQFTNYNVDLSSRACFFNYIIHFLNTSDTAIDIDESIALEDSISASVLLVMKGLQTDTGGSFSHSVGCRSINNLSQVCARHNQEDAGITYIPKTDNDPPHHYYDTCNPHPPGDPLYLTIQGQGNCQTDAEICCKSTSCFTYLNSNPHACAIKNRVNNPYGKCVGAGGGAADAGAEECDSYGACCGVEIHNSIEKLFNDIYLFNKFNGQRDGGTNTSRLVRRNHIRNYIYGELINFDRSAAFVGLTPTPERNIGDYNGAGNADRTVNFDSTTDGIKGKLDVLAEELISHVNDEVGNQPPRRNVSEILGQLTLNGETTNAIYISGSTAIQAVNPNAPQVFSDEFNTTWTSVYEPGSGTPSFAQRLSSDLSARSGVSTTIDTIKNRFENFITGSAGSGGLASQILNTDPNAQSTVINEIKISIILLDYIIPPGIAGIQTLNQSPLQLSYPEDVYNKATFAMAL